MSLLIATQPLLRVIPDLDRLIANPSAFLAERPVVIRSKRYSTLDLPGLIVRHAYPTVALIAPFLWLCVVCIYGIPFPGNWLALGLVVVGTVFATVRFVRRRLPIPCELELRERGVYLNAEKQVIVCPWELFSAAGEPFIDSHQPRQRIALPIAPLHVSEVELRCGERVVRRGRDIQTQLFRFLSDGEVELVAGFEAHPNEVGMLLLRLGNQLSLTTPAAQAPSETAIKASQPSTAKDQVEITTSRSSISQAYFDAHQDLADRTLPDDQALAIDRDGWITIALTRLALQGFLWVAGKQAVSERRLTESS